MAREAIRRLYDVDQSSLVLTKLRQSEKYDIGTVAFRAKPGKLISLDLVHESVWATRLSQGTSSGLVSLDVTAIGELVVEGDATRLKVAGANEQFLLARSPDEKHREAFDQLKSSQDHAGKLLRVSGRIDGWSGRWPGVLKQLPVKPRKILVTKVEWIDSQERGGK